MTPRAHPLYRQGLETLRRYRREIARACRTPPDPWFAWAVARLQRHARLRPRRLWRRSGSGAGAPAPAARERR